MTSEIDATLYGTGLTGAALTPAGAGALRQRCVVPPFSVLDTRQAYWIERRRRWVALGIQSELGRDAEAYPGQEGMNAIMAQKRAKKIEPGGGGGPNSKYGRWGKTNPQLSDAAQTALGGYRAQGSTVVNRATGGMTGTSIFDPVLCELAYTWWCPPAGVTIDPFAGGSVRGIVGSVLGRKYWGCDLSAAQIAANQAQLTPATTGQYRPKWVQGDSFEVVPTAPAADFILSCPPYGNLEQYSDDPADISNKPYPIFLARYAAIIARAAARLKSNRFAVWVVSNFRDGGRMRDFAGDSVRAWEAAGLQFHNDAILLNSVGTAAMRSNGTFVRGHRKLVKVHQNILVFVKGDPEIAAGACGYIATE